jgi:hypothetical protein
MHSRHDTALLQDVCKSDGHRQVGIWVTAYQSKEQDNSGKCGYSRHAKESMTCRGGPESEWLSLMVSFGQAVAFRTTSLIEAVHVFRPRDRVVEIGDHILDRLGLPKHLYPSLLPCVPTHHPEPWLRHPQVSPPRLPSSRPEHPRPAPVLPWARRRPTTAVNSKPLSAS